MTRRPDGRWTCLRCGEEWDGEELIPANCKAWCCPRCCGTCIRSEYAEHVSVGGNCGATDDD